MKSPEEILSELIKIKSVNPPGGELEVALYVERLLKEEGVEGELFISSKGRGSFIAEVGEGERSLLLLSHTDVVPAGEGWDFDPFGGEIRDGYVRGRGAIDCKGLLAAQLHAFLELSKEKLGGRVLLAATCDEERGGGEGVVRLLERFPEKFQVDFVLTEGAEGPIRLEEGEVHFVQVGEKGSAWTTLRTRGLSCHGSVPTLGENAVLKMVEVIRRVSSYSPAVQLTEEVRELLTELLRLQGAVEEVKEEKVDRLLERLNLGEFAESLRALTRMTLSPNVIRGGEKVNVVPDSCQLELDVRILPGQDELTVREKLREVVGEEVEVEVSHFHSPSLSPRKSLAFEVIKESIQKVTREVVVLPYLSPGATDSRHFRERGIPSYGISPLFEYEPSLWKSVHGRNERISVGSLRKCSQCVKEVVLRYLGRSQW